MTSVRKADSTLTPSAVRPGRQPGALDRRALLQQIVDELGRAVAERRADRVEARLGERLEEGVVAGHGGGRYRGARGRPDRADRLPRRPARAGALRRLRPQRPAGARAARTSHVVVTGVSAGRELFERAIDAGAGLVLVHHGLFWKGRPLALDAPGEGAPAAAVRRRRRARRLPPAARRATPSTATTRCSPPRSAPSARRRSRRTPAAPIGVVAHLPGDGITPGRARRAHARGRRRPRAARVPRRARTASAASAIVSGGGSPYLARRDRRRASTRSSPASRPSA